MRASVKYRYGVPENSIGPRTGISDRIGILIFSMVGGVFSHGVLAEDPQEEEVRDPERADVDDDAGDDLVHLVADPEPGQQEADSDTGEHGHADAEDHAEQRVARRADDDARAIAAVQAPMRNLPSMAMFSRPLRSDRMPANAPSEIGTAYSSVPGEDAGHVRDLAVQERRDDGRDVQRHEHDERLAPRECRRLG